MAPANPGPASCSACWDVGIARALDVTERFRNALSLFSAFIFHFRMRKNENSTVRARVFATSNRAFCKEGVAGQLFLADA